MQKSKYYLYNIRYTLPISYNYFTGDPVYANGSKWHFFASPLPSLLTTALASFAPVFQYRTPFR